MQEHTINTRPSVTKDVQLIVAKVKSSCRENKICQNNNRYVSLTPLKCLNCTEVLLVSSFAVNRLLVASM